MMAKQRENRYNSVEELLADLEALRQGQPPLRAHRKFDVSDLEQLEKGEALEDEERGYDQETIAQYRTAIFISSAAAVVFLIIIILMLIF
jgi:hypothetical protein